MIRNLFAFCLLLISQLALALTEYEAAIPSRSCTGNPSRTLFITANADWANVNSSSYDTICVAPGDYTAAGTDGTITLTQAGSVGTPRVIRWWDGVSDTDSTTHPVAMASGTRAKIKALVINGADYLVLDRLWITGSSSNGILFTTSSGADYNILNRLLVEDTTNTGIHLGGGTNSGRYTKIQNSVIRMTAGETKVDHDGIYYGGASGDTYIVNNEVIDYSESIQGANPDTYAGTVIYNNDLYMTNVSRHDCTSPYAQNNNGKCACSESAIVLKTPTYSAGKGPTIIKNNRAWNWFPTANSSVCPGTASTGQVFNFSSGGGTNQSDNVLVLGNVITDSRGQGVYFGNGTTNPINDHAVANLIVDILGYDTSSELNTPIGSGIAGIYPDSSSYLSNSVIYTTPEAQIVEDMVNTGGPGKIEIYTASYAAKLLTYTLSADAATITDGRMVLNGVPLSATAVNTGTASVAKLTKGDGTVIQQGINVSTTTNSTGTGMGKVALASTSITSGQSYNLTGALIDPNNGYLQISGLNDYLTVKNNLFVNSGTINRVTALAATSAMDYNSFYNSQLYAYPSSPGNSTYGASASTASLAQVCTTRKRITASESWCINSGQPGYLSPLIDAQTTAITTVTMADASTININVDAIGNPIWGTRDSGAVEYQPPYVLGTDKIPAPSARIYQGDQEGRARALAAVTTTCPVEVTPASGTWNDLTATDVRPVFGDITNMTCPTSLTTSFTFTPAASTNNPVVKFKGARGQYYQIKVDGALAGSSINGCSKSNCLSDKTGLVQFSWNGALAAAKTFTITTVGSFSRIPIHRIDKHINE